MDDFSFGGAWSQGFRFFAGHWLAHGAILVLLGILVPLGLNYAILGDQFSAGARPNPTPVGSMLFDNPEILLVMALGFLCQSASYFASWRLGFDPNRSVGGALAFGVPAGLIAVICIFLAYVAAAYLWVPLLTPETVFLAVLVFLLPIILVTATFFVAGAAFMAAAVILLLVFAMIYGAAVGQMGLAATATIGSGAITVLLLVLSGFTFWLAARMSCVGPLMAEWKSANLFAAIRESWRLTWEEQWAITRYLVLIGGVFALIVLGGSIAIGASTTSFMPVGDPGMMSTIGQIAGYSRRSSRRLPCGGGARRHLPATGRRGDPAEVFE